MISQALTTLLQAIRIGIYRLLSDCRHISGRVRRIQPVLLRGDGQIGFLGKVKFGVKKSPGFLSTYGYIEARSKDCHIQIGDRSWFNNGCTLIAEHADITIGSKVLLGVGVQIYSSDFHGVHPDNRGQSIPEESKEVRIEDNVFIGSNAIILKGVVIGRNSIIGANSLVTGIIPENSIAAGNPARVIRSIST